VNVDLPASQHPSSILVENESGVACDTASLAAIASFLMIRLGLHPSCELGITLVDVARMSDLHLEWMDEPGPTDVLSFPMDELREPGPGEAPPEGILGDIVLCPEYVHEQATAKGRLLDEELQFLVTHGILHLLGYDHATAPEYDAMFALQDALLEEWATS
jgi:probable rRNA maturation factor